MRVLSHEELPVGYEPPAVWNTYTLVSPDDESPVYDKHEWPVITVRCDSFEEFVKVRWPIMSLQHGHGPWISSFAYAGHCGGCDGFVAVQDAGDYLCASCRE